MGKDVDCFIFCVFVYGIYQFGFQMYQYFDVSGLVYYVFVLVICWGIVQVQVKVIYDDLFVIVFFGWFIELWIGIQ